MWGIEVLEHVNRVNLFFSHLQVGHLGNLKPTLKQRYDMIFQLPLSKISKVKPGSKMINVCFEPKSFAVEIDTDNGKERVGNGP